MDLLVSGPCALHGDVQVPGDKSLSHRAIILGSLANGITTISGFLPSEDCLATLQAMRQMGVSIEYSHPDTITIQGVGRQGLKAPTGPIDCKNSGTTMRLLAGVLAGQSFQSQLVGDASLHRRPMERIVLPLEQMGAIIQGSEINQKIFPPLTIQGNPDLKGLSYVLPLASAQVKSCLLLAGLNAREPTQLIEKYKSRDHTERLLKHLGCQLDIKQNQVTIAPYQDLTGTQISIPGDISSAAFFIAGASMREGSHILLSKVGVNPYRTGILDILKKMGAHIVIHSLGDECGEPVANIEVMGGRLSGIKINPQDVVSAIDEFPMVFIASACAQGETIIRGAEELRFKETDRIEVMAKGLQSLGIKLKVLPDGLVIEGSKIQGGTVDSKGDHRVAMAFAMAALKASHSIRILDCENIATSFPNFCQRARKLGIKITEERN